MGAELEDPNSLFKLAEIKRKNKTLYLEQGECIDLYMRSLKKNYAQSAGEITEYLLSPKVSTNDKIRILKKLRDMHDGGNELASFVIARYIRINKKDEQEKARNLFLHASEKGLVDAHVSAGEMIINGIGGEKDPSHALKLFLKAAHSGHIGAMYACAVIYQGGHGVEQDLKQTIEWHKRAAAGGHVKSRDLIKRYQADHGAMQETDHS